MPLNDAALNLMADALADAAPYLSLHSADPGSTGLHETTAGRLAAGWSAPVVGSLIITNKNFHGGEPNGPVTHVGFWSAPIGGIFYGSGELTGDSIFNPVGDYIIISTMVNGSSP